MKSVEEDAVVTATVAEEQTPVALASTVSVITESSVSSVEDTSLSSKFVGSVEAPVSSVPPQASWLSSNWGWLAVGVGAVGGGIALAGGGSGDTTPPLIGIFTDSAVGGVDYYINGVKVGTTDASGKFSYKAGDTITFKVGNVTIGDITSTQINADGKVLPQDLVGVARTEITNATVVKIAQFLQTLDSNSSDTVITVDTSKLATTASGDVSSATLDSSLFAAAVTVVTTNEALAHLGTNTAITVPILTSINIVSATGVLNSILNTGDNVSVKATMNEIVTVSGTPQIALNIGGVIVKADYVSGSGTKELTFTYTILSGQTDANGISIDVNALTLNGGTINNTSSTSAILNYLVVADNGSYIVDTTPPSTPTISPIINTQNSSFDSGFSVDAGANVTVTIDGVILADLNSKFTKIMVDGKDIYTAKSNIFVGSEIIKIDATIADSAGNVSPLAGQVVLNYIDNVSPTTPTVNAIATDDVINITEQAATVTVTGTNELGSSVTVNG
ncbi:MAG: hypothetical protein WC691_10650, partial [Sulfuricurvum sp.]